MLHSGLSRASFDAPVEVVRWHGAMQAQDYGPAKWSIGQRTADLVDEDVGGALTDGSVVRTHVLRPTWHFVARDDVRWMLALTGPRVHRHNERRYGELGLDAKTRARCERVIASALADANRLTRKEIGEVLARARIDPSGQRLPYILLHCELEALIGSGGLAGKQHTYALLDDRVPNARRFDHDDATVELTRRHLQSHGPATEQDLRWWSSLTLTDIRKSLHDLGPEAASETVDGLTFWSIANDDAPPSSARGVHLLQIYDELFVGYTESRYFGDPRSAQARAAWTNQSVPNGVILQGGRVAGHWRRTVDRGSVRVDAFLYDELTPSGRRALQSAANRLGRFLGSEARLDARRL